MTYIAVVRVTTFEVMGLKETVPCIILLVEVQKTVRNWGLPIAKTMSFGPLTLPLQLPMSPSDSYGFL